MAVDVRRDTPGRRRRLPREEVVRSPGRTTRRVRHQRDEANVDPTDVRSSRPPALMLARTSGARRREFDLSADRPRKSASRPTAGVKGEREALRRGPCAVAASALQLVRAAPASSAGRPGAVAARTRPGRAETRGREHERPVRGAPRETRRASWRGRASAVRSAVRKRAVQTETGAPQLRAASSRRCLRRAFFGARHDARRVSLGGPRPSGCRARARAAGDVERNGCACRPRRRSRRVRAAGRRAAPTAAGAASGIDQERERPQERLGASRGLGGREG